MDEHRIYFDEARHGDIQKVAIEFGTSPEYVSRAVNGDDSPVRRYLRWIRAWRAVRPRVADRIEELATHESRGHREVYEPVGNWNHDEEVRALYREVSEGFEAALRNASPRELRRELLADVRATLDRWERRVEQVEREGPRLQGVKQ